MLLAYQALKSYAWTFVILDGLILVYRIRTGSL